MMYILESKILQIEQAKVELESGPRYLHIGRTQEKPDVIIRIERLFVIIQSFALTHGHQLVHDQLVNKVEKIENVLGTQVFLALLDVVDDEFVDLVDTHLFFRVTDVANPDRHPIWFGELIERILPMFGEKDDAAQCKQIPERLQVDRFQIVYLFGR